MIKPEKLKIGDPYFIFGYFDADGKFPNIRTMVFIGKNIEIDGYPADKDEFFFQDPGTYSRFGMLLTHSYSDIDNNVIAVSEDDLFDFCDSNGLLQELNEFASTRGAGL